MFRHIVNIGGRREKLGVVIEIHENDKRVGFGRAMGGDTARSFPCTLSAGFPYAVLASTSGRASPILRTVSKLITLLDIRQHDSLGLAVLFGLSVPISNSAMWFPH